MPEVLQPYFEWPTLPFSILLCVVIVYWLLMIVSGIDLDIFDVDLDIDADIDADADASVFGWGMVGLKWFNLGQVPLMLWTSIFALAAWVMSVTFDEPATEPLSRETWIACLRNIGVAMLAAKVVTQPLKGMFKVVEPNTVNDMLGRECIITTTEADETFGQARCQSDGAPLMLNVRTTTGTIAQGGVARIVDYSPDDRVYIIEAA